MGSLKHLKRARHYGKVETSLNKRLDDVEWGEFRIEDVLQWQSQKEIDPLKLDELKDTTEIKYPFYGQSTTNNGIISYRQLINKALNNENGKPTILIHSNNQNIIYLETPFYLKDGHGATSVLQSQNLNKMNQMFIISAIDKVIKSKYSYNKKATKIELKNTVIQLPTKNKKIDFDFMESFISDLEAERIAKLEAYLKASGLEDYTLTIEEQKVLDDFENETIEFDKFKIKELFEINSYKKRFDANKVVISEVGKPYVVRTALNNGIRGYIKEDEQFLNEGNTISFGQDTATMFYQEKPYFTGDKIKIIKSKDNRFNKENGLFFIATMTKSFSSFSWGGSSFNVGIIGNQLMKLPTKNKEPDYTLMQTLISAIQKQVIKDVVLYTDKKLGKA